MDIDNIENEILGAFTRYEDREDVMAKEQLINIFTKLPLDHPLRIKYNPYLKEYRILDIENGS